jgi:hypothetical protein
MSVNSAVAVIHSLADLGLSGETAFNCLKKRDIQYGLFGIGFHFVIKDDGALVQTRDLSLRSPHNDSTYGYTDAIAVGLLGNEYRTPVFTDAAWKTLKGFLEGKKAVYLGHHFSDSIEGR